MEEVFGRWMVLIVGVDVIEGVSETTLIVLFAWMVLLTCFPGVLPEDV